MAGKVLMRMAQIALGRRGKPRTIINLLRALVSVYLSLAAVWCLSRS